MRKLRKFKKIKTVNNIYKKINKLFKCSCKNRTFHRKCKTRNTRNTRNTRKTRKTRNTRNTRKRIRGGNYAKDVTMTELEGVASKSLDGITVAIPGSVMSGSAYKKHMEYLEMHGTE